MLSIYFGEYTGEIAESQKELVKKVIDDGLLD